MNALVLYSATGQGFKSPADSIARELEARGVGAESLDAFLEFGMPRLDFALKEGWKFCLRHPWIFRIVYALTDSPLFDLGFSTLQRGFNRRFAAYLERHPCDFVVCSHYAVSWLVARFPKVRSGELPFFGYNSDVLLSHRAYIQKDAAAYFVSTELGRDRMIAQGMPPERLRLTGFPIDPKYKRAFGSLREERARLGLEDRFTLLVTFGGEGIGKIGFLERLADLGLDLQVVAVCGRNEALKARLEALRSAKPGFRLHVLGFTTNLQDYLYACDVSAGKAGLNTAFEAIYLRRPFLVLMAMANERHCADFLVERGYGIQPRDEDGIVAFLERALRGEGEIAAMRRALERPPCGFDIGDMVEHVIARTRESRAAAEGGEHGRLA